MHLAKKLTQAELAESFKKRCVEVQFLASVPPKGERSWDIYIYECPTCGPIYMTREKVGEDDIGDNDRDFLVGAPRKPPPTVNSSAIAVPEPDEDDVTQTLTAEWPNR